MTLISLPPPLLYIFGHLYVFLGKQSLFMSSVHFLINFYGIEIVCFLCILNTSPSYYTYDLQVFFSYSVVCLLICIDGTIFCAYS